MAADNPGIDFSAHFDPEKYEVDFNIRVGPSPVG